MMEAMKLSVPTPCPKKWENLQGTSNRRYCSKCTKHVQDFSSMTTQEIMDYLSTQEGSVCGVFKKEDLHEMTLKEKIIFNVKTHQRNPFKLTSVVVTLCFSALFSVLSSCVQNTMGEATVHYETIGKIEKITPSDTTKKCSSQDSLKSHHKEMGEIEMIMGDTIDYNNFILGEIAPYHEEEN